MDKKPTMNCDAGAVPLNLDLLPRPESTHTIDLDGLFSKDVTSSGSFKFPEIRNVTFGKLLQAMPLPTLLIDKSHAIVFANEAAARIEPDGKSVIGGSFSELFPIPAESEKAISALNRIFSQRQNQTFESLLQINGKMIWGRVRLRSIRFRNVRSVLAMVEDLTAEKKQLIINEKYHQLVEMFPVGIAEFSLPKPVATDRPTDQILEAVMKAKLVGGNIQFAKMLGHVEIEGLKGARPAVVFPFADSYIQSYRLWINEGFPIRTFETKEIADGGKRHFENTLVGNIRNESLYAFWVMRQDITLRKQSEEALKNARDMLEERVKERTAALQRTNERLMDEIAERERTERKLAKLVGELQAALAQVKTLTGLLPICASCKKIRDDRGYWTQVEVYVSEHSDADFTHSICPDCAARLYPDFYNLGK
jgi:PAS domain S-box-containing protein